MHEFNRVERVATAIQRELANVLRHQIRDPRLHQITIQEVRVVSDLSHARVFFTLLETDQANETAALLNKAANFIRRNLAHNLTLRTVPQLHFEYDHSFETGMHLSHLIEQAVAQESPDTDTADNQATSDGQR